MDERDPLIPDHEDADLHEVGVVDRFFLVIFTVFAGGAAVTLNLVRLAGFELWMVIPGAAASFAK